MVLTGQRIERSARFVGRQPGTGTRVWVSSRDQSPAPIGPTGEFVTLWVRVPGVSEECRLVFAVGAGFAGENEGCGSSA